MKVIRVLNGSIFRHTPTVVNFYRHDVVLMNVTGHVVYRGAFLLRSTCSHKGDIRVQPQLVMGLGRLFSRRETFHPRVTRSFFFSYDRSFRSVLFIQSGCGWGG